MPGVFNRSSLASTVTVLCRSGFLPHVMKEVFVCVERSRQLFSNRLFAMSRAHRSVASVILLLTVCGGVSKVVSDEQPTSLKVKNAFLWPVSTLRLERALSSCHEVVTGCRGGPREMEAILAEIAVEAFTRYVDEILPRELEVEGTSFAADHMQRDASRVHLAFLRWQQLVFFKRTSSMGLMKLDEGMPRLLPNISYDWEALYDSPAFLALQDVIGHLTDYYMEAVSAEQEASPPKHGQIFVWAEVYHQSGFASPHSHIGALTTGTFFAQVPRGTSQRLTFEDPRGINPPFGKTATELLVQGDVLMWPSWVSHFMSPQSEVTPSVVFNFVTLPPDGAVDFDKDLTSSYAYFDEKVLNKKQTREVRQQERKEL